MLLVSWLGSGCVWLGSGYVCADRNIARYLVPRLVWKWWMCRVSCFVWPSVSPKGGKTGLHSPSNCVLWSELHVGSAGVRVRAYAIAIGAKVHERTL